MAHDTESFIREVDDALRQDRAKAFWSRYRYGIIGGCIALILGVAGFEVYTNINRSRNEASGQAFLEALEALEKAKGDAENASAARARLAEIEAGGSETYRELARLIGANELVKEGNAEDALARFSALAADADATPIARSYARLQAAYLLLQAGKTDALKQMLASELIAGAPYRALALELLALASFSEQRLDDARAHLDMLAQLTERPPNLGNRMVFYRAWLETAQAQTQKKTEGEQPPAAN